jgi:branched-chain amino acid aminotransferase
MPIQPTELIWMDGALVPWDEAKVHVLTHSLHYGSGVFEGIRAYDTANGPGVFRLTEHMQRLVRSAQIYMIDLPFNAQQLVEATKETVRANGLPACYIRPLVYLGYGEMGLNPLIAPVKVAIITWPWGAYLGDDGVANGVRMMISSWRRHDPNIIPPAAKGTGQYINSQMAKVQAVKAGYDEAIMLNPQGFVAEATGENVFLVRDGVLITPPASAGALVGVTRDSIITIARDLGVVVVEESVMRSDLYTADEVFLTGTAAEVVPVREIDDREIGEGKPGPLTRKLQETFHATVRGEVDAYRHWVELC